MSKQGRLRTQEMRKELEAAKKKQAAKERLVKYGFGAVILALVVAIGIAVAVAMNSGPAERAKPSGKVVAPATATKDGAIPLGNPDAPVTVDLYYDYMCPACGMFEELNAPALDSLLAEDKILLQLRPIAFLDEMSSGTKYSTRAANAFATVADEDPEVAFEFHKALYASQPAEGSEGLSDRKLAELALEAGVSQATVDKFSLATHDAWITEKTNEALAPGGIDGTPTVKINGKVLEAWSVPGALEAAVAEASK